MAKVGDKTHTQHGVGTITEVDTVRGRTQYRVAGAGFNVWLDETKIHVANEGGGLFGYGPWAEEARENPQYALGIGPEHDPSIEHFAGLDATIEPGSTPVNENNSTTLPYDWTPQYHHDVWADEQTIQPGEQEIDADDRLRATDSVSGESKSERPYPGPNPDLFAKSSAYDPSKFYPGGPYGTGPGWGGDIWGPEAGPNDYKKLPDNSEQWNHPHWKRPEGDHRWDAGTAPDGYNKHHAWKEGDPVDWSGGYPMDPETGEDLSIDPRPRATNPDYLESGGRVPDPTGVPLPDDWQGPRKHAYYDEDFDDAPFTGEGGTYNEFAGYEPDDRFRDHPDSWTHEPTQKDYDEWNQKHPDLAGDDPWKGGYHGGEDNGELPGMQRAKGWNGLPDYDWAPGYTPDEQDKIDRSHLKHPESGELSPGESWGHVGSTYRPAGLSDRYAYFELEATDNDSKVAQFRRDPVGFIQLCGHLWTDGDDSLEKYADYTQLIDVDPTMREAAWSDVRQKAQRLRREGRVHVNDMGEGRIYATVEGDHGTYDTMIAKGGSMGGFGGGQSITNWACSCDWGKWAFKRQMTYVGRLCSHGYATYLTMQSDYTKNNPITKSQPYKSKWAAVDKGHAGEQMQLPEMPVDWSEYGFSKNPNPGYNDPEFWQNIQALQSLSPELQARYIQENAPHKNAAVRVAGIVEDYKSWLEDNGQNAEATSVAAFLSTHGDDNPEDAEALYDYISNNHAEAPERDFDIDYVTQPADAYKTSAYSTHSQPHKARPKGEGYGQQLPDGAFDIADAVSELDEPSTPDGYWMNADEQLIPKHADLLRTTPRSLTPDLRAVPEGEGEQWVDVTKDDRETTGPDQIVKDAAWVDATLRFLHGAGEGITDFATGGGSSSGFGAPSTPTPSAPSTPSTPSGGSGSEISGLWDATSVGGTNVDSKAFQQTGSRRFAESSDAALLDKLRELSTTPAAEDLGHMDDHNSELRDVVDELQDRGYDASFMVAAVEDDDDPSDGKGDFSGRSVADWAAEPFAGSGPAPKDWFSDSAGYVDENERDRFIDVTDAPDGDIIKFNDSRSAPQQGPKKSSRRHADNFSPDSTANAPAPMPNMGLGTPDTPSEPFDVSQTLASLHLAGEPDAEDWENASGEPFLDEVKKDIAGDDEGDGEDGGGGGAGSALPGLVKGLGGGGGGAAAGAAGAAGGAGAASELAGLAVLAAKNCTGCGKPIDPLEEFPGGKCLSCHAGDPAVQHDIDNMSAEDLANMWGADVLHKHHRGSSDGVRRAGRGASAQVRIDPGTRQPNRPRQAMSPPDDFGYSGGEIHMVAPEDDNGDDIVAAFQRSAGAAAVMGNAPSGGDDIADRALAFLRTAGRKYSPAEQRELEAEHHPLGARNLPTEDELSGTHYVLGL